MPRAAQLAPFACRPERSRGRLWPEPESGLRSPFQRDRDRIVHSAAFRRLVYKTQVFVYHEGDHFRSRLTHTLEVAQIARTVARPLGLDEDLAEAVALAHDLGHSPFGHAGEDALNEAMAAFGGFDHNVQALRVLTRLEGRYAEFDGLNLTRETLEGVLKHNGPVVRAPVPRALAEFAGEHGIPLQGFAAAEAQVAALADDVAYTNHDLDDGLRAGLFETADLRELPLVGPTLAAVSGRYPALEPGRVVHETIRRLIDAMVMDLVEETRRRAAAAAPRSPDDVRGLPEPLVAFSPAMAASLHELRAFLRRRMYSHYKVARMQNRARRVVRDLFDFLFAHPECLPTGWRERAGEPGSARTARAVADYIAGMTDRFAHDEHDRLFNLTSRER